MSRQPPRQKKEKPTAFFQRPAHGIVLWDGSVLLADDYTQLTVGMKRDTLEVLWAVAETAIENGSVDVWYYANAVASVTYHTDGIEIAASTASGSSEEGGAPVGTA